MWTFSKCACHKDFSTSLIYVSGCLKNILSVLFITGQTQFISLQTKSTDIPPPHFTKKKGTDLCLSSINFDKIIQMYSTKLVFINHNGRKLPREVSISIATFYTRSEIDELFRSHNICLLCVFLLWHLLQLVSEITYWDKWTFDLP